MDLCVRFLFYFLPIRRRRKKVLFRGNNNAVINLRAHLRIDVYLGTCVMKDEGPPLLLRPTTAGEKSGPKTSWKYVEEINLIIQAPLY
jgi:hypothetical protein